MQVWWYAVGVIRGKLVCHDLASGRTDELNPAGIPATVLCLHLDAENNIWAGHRGGLVQVCCQLTLCGQDDMYLQQTFIMQPVLPRL